jgi:hypothetical protein
MGELQSCSLTRQDANLVKPSWLWRQVKALILNTTFPVNRNFLMGFSRVGSNPTPLIIFPLFLLLFIIYKV